ncbi:MAG: hypothetical protein D6802_11575 [Ardenticatenia bacterium]|nr:MAG: hypothetical protein D6802_11575 [Ardenticatenia bacterium]
MTDILQAVAAGLPLFADLNRADVILYEVQPGGSFLAIEHARPHSVPPVHTVSLVGRQVPPGEQEALDEAFAQERPVIRPREQQGFRSHIVQEAVPIFEQGRIVGVLSIEKSLIEFERHLTRSWVFRRTLYDLRDMLVRGRLSGLQDMSPFRETDGLMVVNESGRIIYLSGLGTHLYRRLQYTEELVGRHIEELQTADPELVMRAFEQRLPFEDERQEGDRIWIRKVIPIVGPRWRMRWPVRHWQPTPVGPWKRRVVLMAIHDATSARRKAEQQAVQRAMVQEIHHRVKNNLQTIASLLRMQSRRVQDPQARQILQESTNRILSVAVVHEFLSQHEGISINLRDVATRITHQMQESVIAREQPISFRVEGSSIFLAPQQTTICALVINELLLNALEHGFEGRDQGEVVVVLEDEGHDVVLQVRDNGVGLPPDFDLEQSSSLGLQIVRTVVQQDLRGTFRLENNADGEGATAFVRFPKALPQHDDEF